MAEIGDFTGYDYIKFQLTLATHYVAIMQGTRVVGLFTLDYTGGTKRCTMKVRGDFRAKMTVSEL